ncbi:MAG: 2Fe-2S iron-sulfur cluster binding domain-containing protein [Glaciimonas sp.]|nr:2Fe-2S iron-sulfur cluster binding domain-containing protein [Glaciimonas sp.]
MMQVYNIEIITQDGETVHFECGTDEDVITAGIRQDVILMSSCREGGCATCKALCTDGEYELVKCTVQALPPEEEEEGFVLLCRTFPRSNLTLEVPYTADRISDSTVERDFFAEVVSITPIASNVMQLKMRRLHSDAEGGASGVTFEPGQFFDIQIPGTEHWRSFSPASLPNPDGTLEFLIRILPYGIFSNYLGDGAHPGQTVRVRGPSGSFYIRENGLRPRYFVAGGTGLAPIVAMVRQMSDRGDPHETRLYFGVNKDEDVFYFQELAALAEGMPNLTAQICILHAGPDWKGVRSNPVEALRLDLEASGGKPDLYLCGPPGMIDATYRTCIALGIPEGNICTEKFLPSGSTSAEGEKAPEMSQ